MTVFWTILAFAGARSAAMTLNRLIDAEIDAKNPRTQNRSIPLGKISKNQALILSILSFLVMLFAAYHLPPLCLWLSPIAIAWLSLYSYTKRFTWLCHLILGASLGGATLGGWIAASGSISGLAPWMLATAVTAWVAGFDILYACQDIDIDRQENLFSIPAKFGVEAALKISSFMHIVTMASLVGVGLNLSLGYIYWIGVIFISTMLLWEHSLVKPNDLSKLNTAFFNVNGYISIATFITILLDRIVHIL
jgi:4-hydroxybenzoate polyprenyltransferase